jgi:cyclophilin family peptidyl-prolyl cis-trans isomerase
MMMKMIGGCHVSLQHAATTQGNFTLELYYQHAPRTCHNFAGTVGWPLLLLSPSPLFHPSFPLPYPTTPELARSGYYNGTIFHRIIKVGGKR